MFNSKICDVLKFPIFSKTMYHGYSPVFSRNWANYLKELFLSFQIRKNWITRTHVMAVRRFVTKLVDSLESMCLM